MWARVLGSKYGNYGLALLATGGAAALRALLPEVLAATPFLAFYPAVALAAMRGFGPGLLATSLSAACYTLWFAPEGFRVHGSADWLRLAIFFAGGVGVSIIAQAQQRARARERQRSEQLQQSEAETRRQKDLLAEALSDQRKTAAALRESEQRVRLKLETILSPDADTSCLDLGDLIDVQAVQSLMDHFHQVSHIPMSVMDSHGKVLVGVGWQDICTQFHRVHPETCRHCTESDLEITSSLGEGEFKLYKCKNHMWDMATPIMIGSRRMGLVLSGQFFFDDEPVDREFFRQQARAYGFEEAKYMASLDAVPRLSRAAVDSGIAFFVKLAHMLSLLGSSNVKLAKSLAENQRQRELLAVTLASIGDAVIVTDMDARVTFLNSEAQRLTGWSNEDAQGRMLPDVFHIVQEETREPVESPADKVRRLGTVVGLANHTVLIARDGRETPIDDSGAPIRRTDGSMAGVVLVFRDFSAQKGAQNALRASEQTSRLQLAVLQSAANAIVIAGPDGMIQWVNDAFTRLTGYSAAEAIGRSSRLLKSGCHEPEFYRELWETVLAGRVWHRELVNRRKDGSLYTEEMTITPVGNSGQITHFVAIKQDVSQRKKREDELHRLNRTLRALSNSSQAMLRAQSEAEYLCDACGIIVEDCGYAMVWVGYAEDDEGKTVRPVAHAGYDEGYLDTLHITWADGPLGRGPTGIAIRTGEVSSCQHMTDDAAFAPWRQEAMDRGYASSLALPLSSESRTFGALTIYSRQPDGFSQDEVTLLTELAADLAYGVTAIRLREERARAGESLRLTLQRVELLAGTAEALLSSRQPQKEVQALCERAMTQLDCHAFFNFLVDKQAGKLHLNASAGVPASEAQRIEWLDYGVAVCGCAARDGCRIVAEHIPTTPDPRTELVKSYGIKAYACHPLVAPGGEVLGTLSFGTKTREVFSEPDLSLMKAVADHVAVAMVRLRAEEELEAARRVADDARQSAEQANQAKDHFLAVLSHELRTPLAPVLATVSMLQRDLRAGATSELDQSLEMIHRNVEMEARLIDDLLDITRIERGKIELHRQPLMLKTIIDHAIDVCRPDIEANQLSFHADLREAGCMVNADAARLQQVFWNLLKNAVKFTPRGGRVSISCRRQLGDVAVVVEDNGVGIDPEVLPKIFNAFEQAGRQTTRQFGGLGLGLTISKAMVELHGGCIEAQSGGKGGGARFMVHLPVAAAPAAAPAGSASRNSSSASRRIPSLRILLVEDHADTAYVMRRLLSAKGHQVAVAGSIAAAMELCTDGAFDLLLSDLGLPDGSGLDLMRRLTDRSIRLPGIALSGYGQESDLQASRAAGFAAHLVKPVTLPKLEDAIARVITTTATRVS